MGEDAAALFNSNAASINLEVDGGAGGGGGSGTPVSSTSIDARSTNSKHPRSSVWANFEEVFEIVDGKPVQSSAICRFFKSKLSSLSSVGTGHFFRHQKFCRKKVDHATMVQSRLAFNSDGSLCNWEYDPKVAHIKLCRLIATLDLPLGIAETTSSKEYIQHARNPRFVKVSR